MIEVTELDVPVIAARPDCHRLASIASLLLTRSISLTSSTFHFTSQRIEEIDAIVAMLPFGFRLDLAASSWQISENASTRLSFSNSTTDRNDVVSVDWDRDESLALTGLAQTYFSRLDLLAQQLGWEDVLTFLAQDLEPRSFTKPQSAVDYLAPLAEPIEVWRNILGGMVETDRVRDIVKEDRVPVRAREDFALLLLLHGVASDLEHVRDLLGSTVSERTRLGVTIAPCLHAQDPDLAHWTDLAHQQGLLDRALVSLLKGEAGISDAPELLATILATEGEGTRAFPDMKIVGPLTGTTLARQPGLHPQNVLDLVLNYISQAGQGDLPDTRSELQSNAAWAFVFASKALTPGSEDNFCRELRRHVGVDLFPSSAPLIPLATLLNSSDSMPANGLHVTRSLQPPQHLTLLDLCFRFDRPVDIIRLLLAWLPDAWLDVDPSPDEFGHLQSVLESIREKPLSERQAMQALTLGLVLELEPLSQIFDWPGLPLELDRFESLFRDCYQEQGVGPAQDPALCHLVRLLEPPGWSRGGSSDRVLIALRVMIEARLPRAVLGMRPVAGGTYVDRAIRAVIAAITDHPPLASNPEFQWWRRLIEQHGFASSFALADIKSHISRGVGAYTVGRLVARSLDTLQRDQRDWERLLEILAIADHENQQNWMLDLLAGYTTELWSQNWSIQYRRDAISRLMEGAPNGPLREQWKAPANTLATTILPDLLSILAIVTENSIETMDEPTRAAVRASVSRLDAITQESRGLFRRRGRDSG